MLGFKIKLKNKLNKFAVALTILNNYKINIGIKIFA